MLPSRCGTWPVIGYCMDKKPNPLPQCWGNSEGPSWTLDAEGPTEAQLQLQVIFPSLSNPASCPSEQSTSPKHPPVTLLHATLHLMTRETQSTIHDTLLHKRQLSCLQSRALGLEPELSGPPCTSPSSLLCVFSV